MKTNPEHAARHHWMLAAAMLLSSSLWLSSAFADDQVPPVKGPDVSTVSSEPYTGPTPQELEKLAQITASPVESTPEAKTLDVSTITTTGGNALTAAEQAKLAAIVSAPTVWPDTFMQKLEPMVVPTEGTPDLTTQELEKRARELMAPNPDATAPTTAPRSGR